MTSVEEKASVNEEVYISNELSPSKKYRITIESHFAPSRFSRQFITIHRVEGDSLIYKIENASLFRFKFFTRQNEEWLFCTGESYMTQVFINLDNGTVYDDTGNIKNTSEFKGGCAFCWAQMHISDDGNTLIVDGCIWAFPYEIRFFDFTDPSKGWPELSIGCGRNDEYCRECDPTLYDDFHFDFIEYEGNIIKFMNESPDNVKSVVKKFTREDNRILYDCVVV